MPNCSVVTVKAFGDFVIACSAIKRFQPQNGENQLGIIAGSHLKNIAIELGVTQNVQFIGEYSYPNIPPAFNFKKAGFLKALNDLIYLRNQIGRISAHKRVVFDKSGLRERYIGFGRDSIYLPMDIQNIYLAYHDLFDGMGIPFASLPKPAKREVKKVLIIPGARMRFRNLPKDLIEEILITLNHRNIESTVITLVGEGCDLPTKANIKTIPRDFGALITLIKSADLVVSADSLSAHLSYYFDIPVFVFTPIPKWTVKWLPVSAYRSQGIATFSDKTMFKKWLDSNEY